MEKYFKTYEDIKGYTSIDLSTLTNKDMLNYIDNYSDKEIAFPIKEGVLISKAFTENNKGILNNALHYYYYKVEESENEVLFHIEVYNCLKLMGDIIFVGESALQFMASNGEIKQLQYKDKEQGKLNSLLESLRNKNSKEILQKQVAYVVQSLIYINLIRKNRNVVYKKIKGMTYKTINKVSKIATEKVEVLNNDKVLYIISSKSDTIKSFRNYTRKTESWNVMGHYRHYKNGLLVWVNSYIKGTGSTKPKHYKIK